MTKILCIYHADCADGFAAAWVVHRRFGDDVEFVAAKYGDFPPYCEVPGYGEPDGLKCAGLEDRDVLIVDFSYPRATLEAMAREARSVLALDHHATAEKDLMTLNPPGGTRESPFDVGWWLNHREGIGNLAAIFDMSRSGCGLTWDYLHPAVLRSRIIDLVEDRDLWRFEHEPDTRRFHAVGASYGYEATPANFARWDEWFEVEEMSRQSVGGLGLSLSRVMGNSVWREMMKEGEAILRAERKLVEGIVRGARRTMRIAGHVVPVACCPHDLASEVGNSLLAISTIEGTRIADGEVTTPPFSATYYDGSDGRRHFSLRSTDESPFHCGDAARALGERLNEQRHGANWRGIPPGSGTLIFSGGGHKNSAGFTAPIGWEGEGE